MCIYAISDFKNNILQYSLHDNTYSEETSSKLLHKNSGNSK